MRYQFQFNSAGFWSESLLPGNVANGAENFPMEASHNSACLLRMPRRFWRSFASSQSERADRLTIEKNARNNENTMDFLVFWFTNLFSA